MNINRNYTSSRQLLLLENFGKAFGDFLKMGGATLGPILLFTFKEPRERHSAVRTQHSP